jgi:hypothetical protein
MAQFGTHPRIIVDRARATLQPLALAMVALLSATFPAYAQDGPALPVHASTYSLNYCLGADCRISDQVDAAWLCTAGNRLQVQS